MKLKITIDKGHEEEILIYAHEKTRLICEIEQLVESEGTSLMGYGERTAVPLSYQDVFCFISEGDKVFAVTESEKLLIKSRLYQLEEKMPENFIRINQSCIANIKKIKKFDASISGTLRVIFKNGYTDYVSRRQMKNVKEKLL